MSDRIPNYLTEKDDKFRPIDTEQNALIALHGGLTEGGDAYAIQIREDGCVRLSDEDIEKIANAVVAKLRNSGP